MSSSLENPYNLSSSHTQENKISFEFEKSIQIADNLYGKGFIRYLYGENNINEAESTLKALTEMLAYCRERKDKQGIAFVTANIGESYFVLEDNRKAEEFFIEAYNLFAELGLFQHRVRLAKLLGDIYSKLNSPMYDYLKAEKFLEESIKLARLMSCKVECFEAYKSLSILYEENDELEKAIIYLKKSESLKKEIELDERQRLIQKFEYESKLSDMEIRYNLELKIKIQEKELLAQAVEYHKKEAELYVHQLVEKNQMLQNILDSVNRASKLPEYYMYESLQELANYIKRNINSFDDSGLVEKKWAETNTEFIERLKLLYPNLTSMECKIASFIKMNLNVENISSILFLSPRTIETHRLNIRRKMKLKKRENLLEILNSIIE